MPPSTDATRRDRAAAAVGADVAPAEIGEEGRVEADGSGDWGLRREWGEGAGDEEREGAKGDQAHKAIGDSGTRVLLL